MPPKIEIVFSGDFKTSGNRNRAHHDESKDRKSYDGEKQAFVDGLHVDQLSINNEQLSIISIFFVFLNFKFFSMRRGIVA